METEKNQSGVKRDTSQYYDLFFGLFNTFVMSSTILVMQENLALIIIAYLCTFTMLVGIVFTFKKKNPFYVYFLYGNIICGSFYTLPGLFFIPIANFSLGIIDYIIFAITIPEVLYLVMLFKNAESFFDGYIRATTADPNIQYLLVSPEAQERFEQQRYEAKQKAKKVKEAHNEKYHRSWIISPTLICIIGFYISIFL